MTRTSKPRQRGHDGGRGPGGDCPLDDAAGCSEHETGLAVDIVATDNQRLDDTQEQTPETIWLHENCWRFGFILRYPAGKEDVTGIDYESWHYRYVGIEAARYLTEQQLTLDEFWAS